MRTEHDDCLLCKINKADKKNSHIIPRFMTKDMLKDVDKRRGYIINTAKTHLPFEYIQDTPKEDHILCSDCEKYFEMLETLFANEVHHKLRDKDFSTNFSVEIDEDDIQAIRSLKSIPSTVYLLIYSIVWRCHITSHLAANFTLINSDAELLRSELLKYKALKKNELILDMQSAKTFRCIPFTLYTSKAFKDKTKNFIDVRMQQPGVVKIMAAEYLISLSFNKDIPSHMFFNEKEENIKMVLMDEKYWDTIIASLVEEVRKLSQANLDDQGETYVGLKKRDNK